MYISVLYTYFGIPTFPFDGILRDRKQIIEYYAVPSGNISSIHNVNNEKGPKLLL